MFLTSITLISVQYLDADLYFFGFPKILLEEMGNNSILITEHRYTPKYDKSRKSGTYCVQFISFKNDERGLKALRWWRERCIEWCYARVEDGKFGDQLYLEDWTQRFEGVHVLQHVGGGLAAWNIQQYDIIERGDQLWGIEYATGREFPVIFYHFHYVRLFQNDLIELGRRELSPQVLNLIYKPYLRLLNRIGEQLPTQGLTFNFHGMTNYTRSWKTPLLFLYRTLRHTYHIYDKELFLKS